MFAGGDTDLYGYCLGDPVNLIDPDGLYTSYIPFGNQAIESAIKERAKEYGVCISPEIESDAARALRIEATKDQVKDLKQLQVNGGRA